MWGLAAIGEQGVANVLDILRGGIDSALLGLGRSDTAELSMEDVDLRDDFSVHPTK